VQIVWWFLWMSIALHLQPKKHTNSVWERMFLWLSRRFLFHDCKAYWRRSVSTSLITSSQIFCLIPFSSRKMFYKKEQEENSEGKVQKIYNHTRDFPPSHRQYKLISPWNWILLHQTIENHVGGWVGWNQHTPRPYNLNWPIKLFTQPNVEHPEKQN
jgi:hypothetical protein